MGFAGAAAGKCLGLIKRVVFERGRLIYLLNIPSFRRSRRQLDRRPAGEKIRIGFILQDPTSWAVVQSVYEAALRDERTEAVPLLVPEMEYSFYIRVKKVDWGKTYRFGEKRFGDRCVKTWNPDTETWTDPGTLDLDYVFMDRPYETYMPKKYRASSLRKICRVCFVPYAPPLTLETELTFNSHFIRNVSLIFAEKKWSYDYLIKKLAPTVRAGDQKVFDIGYPKYDLNREELAGESPVWPRERQAGRVRIMWTPRWTMDPMLCASSFFRYKDDFLRLAEERGDIDLVFRPHPLALRNYVEKGYITQEDLDDYICRLTSLENAALDQRNTYYDTFWSSDILISDMSSMLEDYLMTGKPIIFCPTQAGKTMSDDSRFPISEFMDGFYTAGNFEEITRITDSLASGEDPKKPQREKLVAEMRRDGRTGEHILETVIRDYEERYGKGKGDRTYE